MNNRSVVVGAEGQIGAAVVARLVKRGDRVLAMDRVRSEQPDQPLLRRLQVDVGRRESVAAAFEEAERWLGGLDVFVNAAGTITRGPFLETSDEDFLALLNTNLAGAFRTSQAAARLMRENGGGRIVHVASIHALTGVAERAAYAASKGGLIAMVRAMAAELGPDGISVNALAPGPTGQGMGGPAANRSAYVAATPIGRVADPDEVAAFADFLTSPDAAAVSGQVVAVDGGLTSSFMPRL